jgi:hypothetical protein
MTETGDKYSRIIGAVLAERVKENVEFVDDYGEQ